MEYYRFVERLNDANREDFARGRVRRRMLRDMGPHDMSETEFIASYRVSHEIYEELNEVLTPRMHHPTRVSDIKPETKILAALGFYASGSYQTFVGQHSAATMSQPSVSRAVREVTAVLNAPEVVARYMHFPQNALERQRIKERFFQKFGIPGVLGCIDGTHVAIVRPRLYEERYFNRKYFHSKNVQIVCDADLDIMSVDPSFGGASHDSYIFNQHPLKHHFQLLNNQGEVCYLLGDSGYAQRSFMMTPIVDAAPETPEGHYTQLQMSARNTIERAIGVLKARWRCLLSARELHYDPLMAGRIVNACSLLHNICNKRGVHYAPLTRRDEALENLFRVPEQHANDNHARGTDLEQGRVARRRLIGTLWGLRNN